MVRPIRTALLPNTREAITIDGGPHDLRVTLVPRLRELGAREPFVFLVPALAAVVLARWLPKLVVQDTWLALVAGRFVWSDGLPEHDTLTIWADGAEWVDQQWLGQLVLYGLHAAGGFRLLGLVHVAVIVAAFTLALAFALRSGATSRSAAAVGAVAFFVAVGNSNIRTQAFAYLFFVLLFWLLASDARRPSRRVFLVLPLLAVWANVHGSALLGAGVVALWALAAVIRAGRGPGAGAVWRRSAVVAVAAALCLLASPYALELPGYYRDVLGAPSFRDLVSEWRPTTLRHDWPFFLLAVPCLWLAANKARRLLLFEQLALLYTFVGALDAIRNIVWFAFVAVMVVPRALDGVWPLGDAPLRPRVNIALSLAAIAVGVVAVGSAAARSPSSYAREYPDEAAATVARATARDPSLRVFANERYADWLLWKIRPLAGRVAFDARFELLGSRQLQAIGRFRRRASTDWLSVADGYRLLVLDPAQERLVLRTLVRDQRARTLYRDSDVAVVLRGGS